MGNDMSNMISKEEFLKLDNETKQLLLKQLKKEKDQTQDNKPKHKESDRSVSKAPNRLKLKNMNPLELFGLDKQYSINDLKKSYRKLLVKFHPDKSGYDSSNDYRIIQKAYSVLLKSKEDEDKMNGLIKQTVESKTQERTKLDSELDTRNYFFEAKSGSEFDNKRFNDMFNNNKFVDAEDTSNQGYEKWMKEYTPDTEEPKISTYNKDTFNKIFEDKAIKQSSSNNKQLVKFIDPESLFTYSGGFEILGTSSNEVDFSDAGKYTDIKKAYSISNVLHPGETKPRESYTTINEIKNARSAPIVLTKEEEEFLSNKQSRTLESENTRIAKLKEKDKMIEDYYFKIHGKTIELPTYKK